MAFKLGVKPWLGTILLGSAALDMVKIMEAEHARLYDFPFGNDSAYWRATSPFHVLSEIAIPFWLYALRATLTHARRQHSLSLKQNRLMCMQAFWSKISPIKILTYS